jgi:hypothetical protein
MKKITAFVAFLLLAFLSLAALPARAAKTLDVEFAFDYQATEYRLYMDGSQICTATAGAEKKISCPEMTIPYGVHLFTMTAMTDGIESKHSTAYQWTYSPIQHDGPVMINFSVTLENGTVVPIGKVPVK